MTPLSARNNSPRSILVRQSQLGEPEDAGPRRPLESDPLLRYGRLAFQPLSSVMRVDTVDPVVALTYDDGPDPEQTTDVLDALALRGDRATFFVLVERAQQYPEILRRMIAEGHQVGLHGLDHIRLTELPGREAWRRVQEGKRILERIIERPVTVYRPAYGAIGMTVFAGCRLAGMEVVIWTAWARDWFDAPVPEIVDRTLTALHPGAIVLLHDVTDDSQALAAGLRPTFSRGEVAAGVLAGMHREGYTSVTVGELLQRYPAVRALTVQRPALLS